MSLRFENALERERERQRRQREGGQHPDFAARMDTPTLSPAGVGSPTAPPPPPLDIRLTDLVTELTGPVDRAQLDQEIEDFNISYPVNVDDALNLFSLPPVAGTGTTPAPTTTTQPVTTPADCDLSRSREHVLSPPPPPPPLQRADPPSPPVDVQAQGPPPRPRR